MDTNIQNYIVKTVSTEWKPLIEEGVDTSDILVKVLRYDEQQKRPPSILLKFMPGASYPYHNHPGGEELFMLKGTCLIEGATLKAGDYLYTPPGFRHGVYSEEGCEFMLIIPEEVEIL